MDRAAAQATFAEYLTDRSLTSRVIERRIIRSRRSGVWRQFAIRIEGSGPL
jgi:hypothetical protein